MIATQLLTKPVVVQCGLGEKKGKETGLGQHCLPALPFLPSYSVELEGIQNSEFQEELPSLINSQKTLWQSLLAMWTSVDFFPQALQMVRAGLWS